MKKLTSLFKRSPSTDSTAASARSPFHRHNLPFTLALTSIVVAVSCQLTQQATQEDAALRAEVDVPSVATNDSIAAAVATSLSLKYAGKTLATAQQPECQNTAGALRISAAINSLFGRHPVELAVTATASADLVAGIAESERISFSSSQQITTRLRALVCSAFAADQKEVLLDDAMVDGIREWLQLTAPDCEITVAGAATEADGWECKLPAADPELAKEELTGIRTTMIRRWSRQPYLLTRRLSVGIQLADALLSKNPGHALNVICNIANASVSAELPATLTSKRVQQVVCSQDDQKRLIAASFVLTKTVAEIDFLRQLFERSSRLGSLTIRVPANVMPGRQLWVSLKPEADVADNLTRETAKLWTGDTSTTTAPTDEATDDLPKACWHPVYAETPQLLKLARNLAMAGDATGVTCHGNKNTTVVDTPLNPERYFADSITSETEFVISNGRSKTLRLPAGGYTYTLQALPDNPEEWDDAAQSMPRANGRIVWDIRRPRPVINSW